MKFIAHVGLAIYIISIISEVIEGRIPFWTGVDHILSALLFLAAWSYLSAMRTNQLALLEEARKSNSLLRLIAKAQSASVPDDEPAPAPLRVPKSSARKFFLRSASKTA